MTERLVKLEAAYVSTQMTAEQAAEAYRRLASALRAIENECVEHGGHYWTSVRRITLFRRVHYCERCTAMELRWSWLP